MRKNNDHIELTLRTSRTSKAPIGEFMHTIRDAVMRAGGAGSGIKIDARRRSQCVLVLPSHFCSVRARSVVQKLLSSATDTSGQPLFEARLDRLYPEERGKGEYRPFSSQPDYLGN